MKIISMKKAFTYVVMGSAILTQMGCEKTAPVEARGNWEITWVRDMSAGLTNAGSLPNLCVAGSEFVIDVRGVVDRKFKGNRNDVQSNVPLVMAPNKSGNKDNVLSKEHYETCDSMNTLVVNRAWAGGLFGYDDEYGYVTTGADGKCVLHISKNKNYRIVEVFVTLQGEIDGYDANGVYVTDANNRKAVFSYDCQTGGYSEYRVANTSAVQYQMPKSAKSATSLKLVDGQIKSSDAQQLDSLVRSQDQSKSVKREIDHL